MSQKLIDAILYASKKHENQKRKVLPFPYIVHPFTVMQTLREEGADEETLITALLHDVVEDTKTPLSEIEELFGSSIATLVGYLTEDKSLPYVERKEEHSNRLAKGPLKARMVKCADCLSNIKELYFNLQELDKDEVWSKFNSTKENIKNHYRHSIEIFDELKDRVMYRELVKYYNLIFQ